MSREGGTEGRKELNRRRSGPDVVKRCIKASLMDRMIFQLVGLSAFVLSRIRIGSCEARGRDFGEFLRDSLFEFDGVILCTRRYLGCSESSNIDDGLIGSRWWSSSWSSSSEQVPTMAHHDLSTEGKDGVG
jgi:hypothetical protein